MPSNKLSASILIINLLILFTFTCACGSCNPKPTPKPAPKPAPKTPAHCPKDTLKLGVCGNLVGGVVSVIIGTPPDEKCCALIQGLTDLEAAVCLCTALKANVLGINLNVPISLSTIITGCGKSIPEGFKCE